MGKFGLARAIAMILSSFRTRRVLAPAMHLAASLGVAVLASILIFAFWYPGAYASLAAGKSLFFLLVSVDVVLGPALTAVAADPGKPRKVLARDLALIVLVQLAGLAYGVYSIAMARPAYLVFEVDRMRVVTVADIDTSTLSEAPPGLQRLPWKGPEVIAAVRPTNPDEVLRSIDLALGGFDISTFPRNWRDYASQKDAVLRVSRPAAELRAKYPASVPSISRLADEAGTPVDSLRFLPVLSRQASWVAVVTPGNATVVGFLPFDGFF